MDTQSSYSPLLPSTASADVSDKIGLAVVTNLPDVIDVVAGECLLLDAFLREELLKLFERR